MIFASLIAGSSAAALSASVSSSPASSAPGGFTLGWYAANSASYAAAAIDALPVKPQVVNYYSGWNQGFNTAFAQAAYAGHVQTFVEMGPWNCGSCAGGSAPAMSDINAVGLDGYLGGDNVTFAMMFGQSLTDMRALTSLPVWIAETGINQDATTAQRLTAYVNAAHAAGVTGLLYFNEDSYALTAAQQQSLASVISSIITLVPGA